MNESILTALLRLFAMIANVGQNGVSSKASEIVSSFLSEHLSARQIDKYLKLFEKYIQTYNVEAAGIEIYSDGNKKKGNSSDTVVEICEQINKELIQREKFIVFLRLVEFINEDEVMTDKELDFVKTVANSFNISTEAHNNTKAFILDPLAGEIKKENMLIVDNNVEPTYSDIRHVSNPGLSGNIYFLHHAATNTFVFKYLGKNTLYLNGHNIIPGRILLLDQGAMITGARIKPVYYSDILNKFLLYESKSKINYTAEKIEFKFKNSSYGIKKFNFSKASGNLVGIMGGSGVGKSTLLNILAGKIEPNKGTIKINGYDIQKDKEKLEGLIGFVPQDDLLMEELTVFQNLYYNARLCFRDLNRNEILRKVNQVLVDIELDDVKHLKVGSPIRKFISGGQRKRLNIALELIREPLILFVDEPTSGLSSMDSEKLMLLLKEQTLKDKLVIVNIHQPFSDIFKLFDRILILDKGGHTIYKGNPIDGLIYFKTLSKYVDADEGQCLSCGNVKPEEILKIVEAREVDEYGKHTRERKVSPEEWYKKYRKKIEKKVDIESKKSKLPEVLFKIPSPFEQFRVFSLRNILSKLADRQYMLINFLEAPLLAVIIGFFTKYVSDKSTTRDYVFQQNENLPAYLFMAVVVSLFMGLMVSAEEIIKDRKILARESFLNLSRISYLNSKILIVFAISAIQTFTFVLVGNLILEIKGMTFAYWLILFTTSCMANMLGLNISSGLRSVITIYILIPFILVPQLLFSGVIVKFDSLNKMFRHPVYVPVIGDLMTSRWAYEALAVHQFKDNKLEKEFFKIDQEISNVNFSNLLVQQLKVKVHETERYIGLNNNMDKVSSNLNLIKSEILASQQNYNWPVFKQIDKVKPEEFDTVVIDDVLHYLNIVKSQANEKNSEMNKLRDEVYYKLTKEVGGSEEIQRLQTENLNIKLSNQVRNMTTGKKIFELDGQYIRQYEPIYMKPTSKVGRAHFYAADKKLGNITIDTFWFNILVIWLVSALLYFALMYDLLKKFVTWIEKLQITKSPDQIQDRLKRLDAKFGK